MTAAQIVAVKVGDRIKVNFAQPFVGYVIDVDGVLARLQIADAGLCSQRRSAGKRVEFWVNMRDDPVERVGVDI